MTRIWADVLGIEQVGIDENFFELGGHSLLTMRLFARIEKAFGRQLPLATLLQAPTVQELASILDEEEPLEPVSSLVTLQSKGTRPPFFWVHGENSNAFLPRHFGPDQPVYALVQESRDGRPARHTRVENIAGYYLRGIRRIQPSGPYFLGGFCFGSIVAFEIAQQLRRQGEQVGLLAMVDPHYGEFRRSPRVREGWSERASRHVQALAPLGRRQKVWYARDGFIRMTRRWLENKTTGAQKLAARLYASSGAGYQIPVSLRIPYINAVHSRAKRGYVPQVYPGRVVTIKTAGSSFDPASVWGRLAAGGLEVHRVPGQHEEVVLDESGIRNLAQQLSACLEKAQSANAEMEASTGSHSR